MNRGNQTTAAQDAVEKQVADVMAMIDDYGNERADVQAGRNNAFPGSVFAAIEDHVRALLSGKCLHQIAEPAPTESVLIDGTAYVVHADVAAELLRLHIELQTAPHVVQAAVPHDIDLPDVEDMAHSAVQEALSFGVNHDVFHRWMRAVMDKTVAALAAQAKQGG